MQVSLFFIGVVLFLLIFLSAFFSGAEIGMMSLNRYRLRHLVKLQNKQALRVNQMLLRPDRLLSVVLIGNTLANIIASMLATLLGQRLYGDAGVALATLVLTLVILVISEMTPKTLAAIYPQQVAFWASFPLLVLHKILSPLVVIISWLAKAILRIFGISMKQMQKESLSGEELRSVLHESVVFLPTEHKHMLISLLDLQKARVEDIMVPKSEIIGLDIEAPWAEILEQLKNTQHTRLPLYRQAIDNVIGLVHLRTALHAILEKGFNKERLLEMAELPYFIPEATPLNMQMLSFQKIKKRSAFVVDEYGELQGLVTLEDILEEVVGEFTTDIAAISKDICPQADGSVIVDASISLYHLQRLLNWRFSLKGPRTLNGLITEHLGYIPPPDCCLKLDNYYIQILEVSGNRIQKVKVQKSNKKNNPNHRAK